MSAKDNSSHPRQGTHLFLEGRSVWAVTKFGSTLSQRCYQTELIFCGIGVILGGRGGGEVHTRTGKKPSGTQGSFIYHADLLLYGALLPNFQPDPPVHYWFYTCFAAEKSVSCFLKHQYEKITKKWSHR